MKIEDINLWIKCCNNIGHIVVMGNSNGIYTACGSLHMSCSEKDCQTEKPSKICSKCRKELKNLTKHTGETK